MGFFDTSNDTNITDEVERATNENNTEENWELIINICDKAGKSSTDAKTYLKTIIRRLHSHDPHIATQAATLLDSCVKNSGKLFHVEVASRDFETEFTKLLTKSHQTVSKKLRESLKRWAETEFKTDPQLNLIPSLYTKLKHSGIDFSFDMPVKKPAPVSKDPNVVESNEEEIQILKAIELSLADTSGGARAAATSAPPSSSLYPSTNLAAAAAAAPSSAAPAKEPKKVRALYDFEAAEDNELTFHSGEIIVVIDDSDPNWWKGSNQRGEGLFPSNFVTKDLELEPEKFLYEKAKKIVQLKENVDVARVEQEPEQVEINDMKIDRLLHLLHEADPTNPETDTAEMLQLEREVNAMGPLIDSELERVDRKNAQLTKLSANLVSAFELYHSLMHEPQIAPKLPYNYNQMSPPPNMGMPQYNTMPHPGMPPPGMTGHDMGPPQGQERPQFMPHNMPHYGTMPMMGMPRHMPGAAMPPPGMPPHMMQDNRRMQNYGPPNMPPNFPMQGPPSQTMLHNGGPPPANQPYMPAPNANTKQ